MFHGFATFCSEINFHGKVHAQAASHALHLLHV